jgi:hypothetical protein
MSKVQACKRVGITLKMHNDWVEKSEAMAKRNPYGCSLHIGTDSCLKPVEEQLLKYIFELRETGVAVTVSMVTIYASTLCRTLRDKKREARMQSVRRWIKAQGYTHRMGTHECQKPPSETRGDAQDYIDNIRPKILGPNRHEDYIYNMDQTPVFFAMNSKRTLELIGKRSVNIRTSNTDTKRMTCGVTITASGEILKPYLIFKGVPNARIAKTEFPYYPQGQRYACQTNAWMDEHCMLDWVEHVLKPHAERAPDGIDPILFLDSYRAHMMGSVVNAIEDIGVEVVIIPGGCTSLVQPVDIGFNRPYKKRMRELWEEWMMDEMAAKNPIGPPTRQHIAQWSHDAMQDMPRQFVINAWRHGEFAYFTPTCAPRPLV